MKKTLLLFIIIGFVLSVKAQRPKMHLKAKAGLHFTSFVYKLDTISRDYFAGAHGGFGFRIMHEKKMGEIGFDFVRNYVTLIAEDTTGSFTLKLNSFEIPLTVGYVTVKKPVFKHFVYGGIVPGFNIKSIATLDDFPDEKPIKLTPKQSGLKNPNFHMRFGTQFDIAMFNVDVHYSIGLNKAVTENYRTQSHSLRLTLGLVF